MHSSPAPLRASAEVLASRKLELVDLIESEVYAAAPGVWERFGEAGRANIRQDIGYNLDFLAESIKYNDAGIFIRYAQWLAELFAGLRLPADTLGQTLSSMRRGIAKAFPASLPDGVAERLDAASAEAAGLEPLASPAQGSVVPAVTPEKVRTVEPVAAAPQAVEAGGIAQTYLDHLLKGDRAAATALVMELVEQKTDIRSIYLDVFQESQYRLGRLWLGGKISVAQEHFCTAATQAIMSRLYPHIFATPRNGKRLVATSASGELHEIGIRILADLFELEGWDSYYLGANTPANAVVAALRDQKSTLLCISATMVYNLKAVESIISAVRQAFPAGAVKILVGGYAFKASEGLWRTMGADGFAANAIDAIQLAESIVPGDGLTP